MKDPKQRVPSSSSSSWSSSKKPRSPTPSVYSSTSRSSSSGVNGRCSNRVVEGDFDPSTRALAVAAKAHFRLITVYDDPFPPIGVNRYAYGWKAIKTMVKDSKVKNWMTALKFVRASDNLERQNDLLKFVSSVFG